MQGGHSNLSLFFLKTRAKNSHLKDALLYQKERNIIKDKKLRPWEFYKQNLFT